MRKRTSNKTLLIGGVAALVVLGGGGLWFATRSTEPATPPAASEKKAEREGGKRKLSFKETRELAELPGKIAALEDEQKAIAARLEDPALYQGAPLEAQQLSERMAAIDCGRTAKRPRAMC